MESSSLRRIGDVLYELDRSARSDLRVPVRVVADEVLLADIRQDKSLTQLMNVATLPGIARYAVGMPDMHEGYGFPVGGVAATTTPDGVISPGGIGFDINCGVRLLTSTVRVSDVAGRIEALVHELSRSIPTGYGRSGRLSLDEVGLRGVLSKGAAFVTSELGLGRAEDLAHTESGGVFAEANPAFVSERAKVRGQTQLGTLGGGNHFLEVQVVSDVLIADVAESFGLFEGQLAVMLHTGSRGLGHQVCSDHVRAMDEALPRLGVVLPDRQLACAPLSSAEGQRYFGAMCAAANFAFANRQVLTHQTREALARILGAPAGRGLRVLYDVAHNIAKLERYGDEILCVHRKGATRAFGPGQPELPDALRAVGQPVLIPGSMGTASFVLVGTPAGADVSFASSCHGAGRRLSRGAAKRAVVGHELRKELEARGIAVRCPSNAELAEEAPLAYKDVERVVDVIERAGIARRVARLAPLGVIKG